MSFIRHFSRLISRGSWYSSASFSKSQSPLAVLRRNTGYPIGKCKEALTKYNNDVAMAENYLREQAQKEGWTKAEKVQGRATNQGLIGVVVRDNKGVMVEVSLHVYQPLTEVWLDVQVFGQRVFAYILKI